MLRWKSRTQRYGSQMWAALWKLELSFKFLISFGKLRNDCLPLSRELRIRNLITDTSCPSCAIEEECLDHQFITYNLTCVTCFRSPLTIRRYLSQIQVIIVLLLRWEECTKHKASAIISLYSFNNHWAIWIHMKE